MIDDLKLNILSFNSDGKPTDNNCKIITDTQFNIKLIKIIKNISESKRVVIYIHGGLNSPSSTIKKSIRLAHQMIKDGITPVFVVWDSRLFPCYLESLLWVRRGIKYNRLIIPILTLPFAMFEDIGRGIGRFLHTILITLGRDAQTDDVFFSKHSNWFPMKERFKLRLNEFFGNEYTKDWVKFSQQGGVAVDQNLKIIVGKNAGLSKSTQRLIIFWMLQPLHWIVHPLLDMIGKRAWDNMLRRTRTLIWHNPDIHTHESTPAFSRFLSALTQLENKPRIDIIGHSMGSIVINEAFLRQPDIPCSNIIFMGAACSVRGFLNSTGKRLLTDSTVNFFNICLHPTAEISEYNKCWLVRGSLLSWIDNFFADIVTYEDRTLGTFENCVSLHSLLPKKRQLLLKSFSIYEEDGPQKHGEFSQYRFWDQAFWHSSDKFKKIEL